MDLGCSDAHVIDASKVRTSPRALFCHSGDQESAISFVLHAKRTRYVYRFNMSSASKARLQQLSEQLVKPREDPGTFENIPRIPTIAGDSNGP